MKKNKIYLLMASAALLTFSACNDLNEQDYEGNKYLSQDERLATNEAIPTRVKATFDGMFNYLGKGGTSGLNKGQRADDFGMVMALLSGDLEGADAACGDNNYNWFSVADELSSRNAQYANPRIRYTIPYTQMGVANQVIASYPAGTTDSTAVSYIAAARAMRAYDYLMLAPYFQFSYATSADKPCVPLLSDSVDATHNPRATVRQVYAAIMNDLNYAVEHLGTARADKQYINVDVAYGLRARANLYMGNWAAAAADAEKVINSGRYTPATRAEVSVPGFDDA
ncbi:MAG: RagB/SusD family nutrient uptake outer membrane protein, partial [Prevotella sp.]